MVVTQFLLFQERKIAVDSDISYATSPQCKRNKLHLSSIHDNLCSLFEKLQFQRFIGFQLSKSVELI